MFCDSRNLADLKSRALGAAVLVALAVAPLNTRTDADVTGTPNNVEPEVYPWSNAAKTVRVPKQFLESITIPVLTVSDADARLFSLKPEFIHTFRLTSSEIEGVIAALTDALHRYRMTEAKKLEPSGEKPNLGPPRGAADDVIEQYAFKLIPFPDEAGDIRKRLVQSVLGILGEERSKYFFRFAESVLNSEMELFSDQSLPPGKQSITLAFVLRDLSSGLQVDRYKITTTQDAFGGHGRGVMRQPYAHALDQYAPVQMKPVLARWREKIAEAGGPATLHSAPNPAPILSERQEDPPRLDGNLSRTLPTPQTWDDDSRFVDLPKSFIGQLRVPGLTVDETVSTEAATLFGLTPDQQGAIAQLYRDMKARFEDLERKHFQRVDRTKHSYVIHAFPEEMSELRRDWTEQMQTLIGPERAQMLDESIRKARSGPPFVQIGRNRLGRGGPGGPPGPVWLNLGTAETRINITVQREADGKGTLKIEYKSTDGGGGSFSGSIDAVPARWRHLLSPAMFQPPGAL